MWIFALSSLGVVLNIEPPCCVLLLGEWFCVKLFLFFLACVVIKCDLCGHIRKSVL